MRKGPALEVMMIVALMAAVLAVGDLRAGAQAQAPLPDRETFLRLARERLTSNDLMRSRYSYKVRSTEVNMNPFGRMGTGPVVVAEVFPSPEDGLTYRRILERDGKPVPPEEIAEQDRRYRRRYNEWRRRLARDGQSAREARITKDAETRAREQAELAEAIDLFSFTIVGRTTWEGQSAILVAFMPRTGVEPHSREGRLAKSFAGRAWIHEFDHELLHVKASAVDDVTFGYGMVARLDRGSVVEATRRRVDGTWFPVETHLQGTGRAFIFRRFEFDYDRKYFDYRPFSPEELPARLGWKED